MDVKSNIENYVTLEVLGDYLSKLRQGVPRSMEDISASLMTELVQRVAVFFALGNSVIQKYHTIQEHPELEVYEKFVRDVMTNSILFHSYDNDLKEEEVFRMKRLLYKCEDEYEREESIKMPVNENNDSNDNTFIEGDDFEEVERNKHYAIGSERRYQPYGKSKKQKISGEKKLKKSQLFDVFEKIFYLNNHIKLTNPEDGMHRILAESKKLHHRHF